MTSKAEGMMKPSELTGGFPLCFRLTWLLAFTFETNLYPQWDILDRFSYFDLEMEIYDKGRQSLFSNLWKKEHTRKRVWSKSILSLTGFDVKASPIYLIITDIYNRRDIRPSPNRRFLLASYPLRGHATHRVASFAGALFCFGEADKFIT